MTDVYKRQTYLCHILITQQENRYGEENEGELSVEHGTEWF